MRGRCSMAGRTNATFIATGKNMRFSRQMTNRARRGIMLRPWRNKETKTNTGETTLRCRQYGGVHGSRARAH